MTAIARSTIIQTASICLSCHLVLLVLLSLLALLLLRESLLELIVQGVDVGQFLALACLQMLLAEFVRETLLSRVVIKGTDLHFVTTHAVALDPLVFVGVVEPFDRSVALGALEALRTVLPPFRIL